MNNGEFYSSNEYNATTEYQRFPAEIYRRGVEVNPSGREQSSPTQEVITLQKSKKIERTVGTHKGVIDRIMGSLKSVATTVTVAAAAVAVTTALIIDEREDVPVIDVPNVELVGWEVGTNFIQYVFEIDDLKEDGQYAVVVTTSNEAPREQELVPNEIGEYSGVFDELQVNWEYTLSVVERSETFGEVVCFEWTVRTADAYDGYYVPPSVDDVTIHWDVDENNHKLEMYTEFENPSGAFRYEIVGTDDDLVERFTVSGDGNATSEVLIDKAVPFCGLTFNVYKGDELMLAQDIGKIELRSAEITTDSYELLGMGVMRVYFELFNPQESTIRSTILRVAYEDGGESLTELSADDLLNGYADVEIEKAQGIVISYSLVEENDRFASPREITTYGANYVLNNRLNAVVAVHVYENPHISFALTTAVSNATYVKMTNALGEELIENVYSSQSTYSMSYTQTDAEVAYQVVLLDENEDAISEMFEIYVPPPPERGEYVLNYKNPSDVGITYNADGTMNVYVTTDFNAEDEELYCQISLSAVGVVYQTREPVARILNVERNVSGIEYAVCKDYANIQYVYQSVLPSGTIAEGVGNEYGPVEGTIRDNTVRVTFFTSNCAFDFKEIKIVDNETGETVVLNEQDVVYDGDEGGYYVTATFMAPVTTVTVCVGANEYFDGLEGIDDLVGDLYLERKIMIQQ